jgi:hypothetical protein
MISRTEKRKAEKTAIYSIRRQRIEVFYSKKGSISIVQNHFTESDY